MATVELMRGGASEPDRPTDAREQGPWPQSRAATTLLVALALLLLYAAFAHGDVGLPTEARVQVAIAALAAVAAAAWLWSGSLRFWAPKLAYAGIASLAAFVLW